MPRQKRCRRWVETRRYATARSIDHTAYHRLRFGSRTTENEFGIGRCR
jgi:hypothetical protein